MYRTAVPAIQPKKVNVFFFSKEPIHTFSNILMIEMLKKYDCNYFSVDWRELAGGIEYPLVVRNGVPVTGKHVGYGAVHI